MDSIARKTCSRCHVEKPVTEFGRNKNLANGCTSACKLCLKTKAPRIAIDVPTPTVKTCKQCHVEKPLEDFYEHKGYQYGRDTVCKSCICDKAAEKYREQHEPKPQAVNGGKICFTCHIEKPFNEFSKETKKKDGHASSCKLCHNARTKQHLRDIGKRRKPVPPPVNGGRVCVRCLVEKPLDKFFRNKKAKDGGNVCKSCINKQSRASYARNKEKTLASSRVWYAANKERHAALTKAWRQENRLRANDIAARRQSRMRAVYVEPVDYEAILERDGMWCYICERDLLPGQPIEFDHEIPIGRGGPHAEINIHPTHRCCNRRKHDKLLSEMSAFQRRGM